MDGSDATAISGMERTVFTQMSLGAENWSEKQCKSFDLCDYVNKEF